MTKPITVLLTNDDGIDAPGLGALERAFAGEKSVTIWIVAPNKERSTSSHAMHLSRPVFAEERSHRRVAVDGYPVDCVYLAMHGLMDRLPDVVVSGINHGANMGSDVIYSGTVACAREAAMRGVHGVAASLVDGDEFDAAAESIVRITLALADGPTKPASILNLNYPGGAFSGPRLARLGVRKYPLSVTKRNTTFDNAPYYWLGGKPVHNEPIPGTDSFLVEQGIASATPLRLDQTDETQLGGSVRRFPFIDPFEETK